MTPHMWTDFPRDYLSNHTEESPQLVCIVPFHCVYVLHLLRVFFVIELGR